MTRSELLAMEFVKRPSHRIPSHRLEQYLRENATDDVPSPTNRPAKEVPQVSAISFEETRFTALDHVIEALVARATGAPPNERSRDFERFASLHHLAHADLSSRGLDRGLNPFHDGPRCVQLAMTSGDLPNRLADVASRIALAAYEHSRPAYRAIASKRSFKNFQETPLLQLGDFPAPLLVGESGEVKCGPLSDSGGESARLASYSRIARLSLAALVNDDVDGFAEIPITAARRAVDLEDSLFFAMLTSGTGGNGPTMADGAQLFATSRGNLAASGSAISTTSIGAARAAVMAQTSPDGIKSIAVPRLLVVPPALATLAEAELAKLALGADPEWRMRVVPAANLSGTAWYVMTDPSERPSLVYGHLGSEDGAPGFIAQEDWETFGVKFRSTIHFAAAAADWRGLYKNPGA